jgi:TetR/AcrR family transcriptional regulator
MIVGVDRHPTRVTEREEAAMAERRRFEGTSSPTRDQLVDAAERLLLSDGYAAVTSRRVGAEAGVTPQLVHYYFDTMDDLFLAVLRRRSDAGLERFRRVLEQGPSLGELWRRTLELANSVFMIEFVALANHRKEIRDEIASYAERARGMQIEATAAACDGLDRELRPVVVMLIMTGLSQAMSLERHLGVTTGHDETIDALTRWFDELDRGRVGSLPENSTRLAR